MHATKAEQVKDELGAIVTAFKSTMDKHGLVNMVVNSTGIESMAKQASGFCQIPEFKEMIEIGELTVFSLCSGKTLQEGKEILKYTINGKETDEKHMWNRIHKLSDMQENYIIWNVQMLGVGTDLPSLNSVVILGDKNETDLFQTIMRGCRVDYNNPSKKDYEVFIFVDGETKAYMENFINTLDKLGGPELIASFSNDVLQGESTDEINHLFTELLQGQAKYNSVIEQYKQIVNCKDYLTRAAVMEAIQLKLMKYLDDGDMDSYQQLRALMTEKLKQYGFYLQLQNKFLYYKYNQKELQ